MVRTRSANRPHFVPFSRPEIYERKRTVPARAFVQDSPLSDDGDGDSSQDFEAEDGDSFQDVEAEDSQESVCSSEMEGATEKRNPRLESSLESQGPKMKFSQVRARKER